MPKYRTHPLEARDFVMQIVGRQRNRRVLENKFRSLVINGNPTDNPRFQRITEALTSNRNLAYLFATILVGTGQTKEAKEFLDAYGYTQEALDIECDHFQKERIPKRKDPPSFFERYNISPILNPYI